MTKRQLIRKAAQTVKSTDKFSKEMLEFIFEEITQQLAKGEKVLITGFGVFDTKMVKAKDVIVPATGERMRVKPHRKAFFRVGGNLKKRIRQNGR
jgi:DNA-binding protein HU-beta